MKRIKLIYYKWLYNKYGKMTTEEWNACDYARYLEIEWNVEQLEKEIK